MKRLISVITLVIFCFIGYSIPLASASEEGNKTLALNKTISGMITNDDPSDYYNITLEKSGKFSLDLSSYMKYLDVELYDEDHDNVLSTSYFEDANDNNPTRWRESAYLERGTYTVKVSKSSGYTGIYSIKSTFVPANNNEVEPNGGTDLAQSLKLNKSNITGLISWNDATDFYKVKLNKAGKLSVDFSSYMKYVYIDVLDENYESIMSEYYFGGASENTAIPVKLDSYLEAGLYYIKINKNGYEGRYKLKANFIEAKNNDKEPNNGIDQAQSISPNTQTITGLISWNDTSDFYKVKLTKAGKLTVNTSSYLRWLDVRVYDKNIQQMMSYYSFDGANENTAVLNTDSTNVKAGTYYISIKHNSGLGKYRLSVKAPSMLPKAPIVNKVKNGANKVVGKTVINSTVTVKIGSKRYTGKSDNKGNYSIKVPKQKAKTKIYVSVKTSSGTSTSTKVVVK